MRVKTKVSKSDFSRQIDASQNKSFKIVFFSLNRSESKQKFRNPKKTPQIRIVNYKICLFPQFHVNHGKHGD